MLLSEVRRREQKRTDDYSCASPFFIPYPFYPPLSAHTLRIPSTQRSMSGSLSAHKVDRVLCIIDGKRDDAENQALTFSLHYPCSGIFTPYSSPSRDLRVLVVSSIGRRAPKRINSMTQIPLCNQLRLLF